MVFSHGEALFDIEIEDFADNAKERGEYESRLVSVRGVWCHFKVFPRGSLESSEEAEYLSVAVDTFHSKHQPRRSNLVKYLISCCDSEETTVDAKRGADFVLRDVVLDPSKGYLDGGGVLTLKVSLQVQHDGANNIPAHKPWVFLKKDYDAADPQDVTFVVKGERFKAHSNILRAIAPGLALRAEAAVNKKDDVEINDISLDMFQYIHQFIYDGIEFLLFEDPKDVNQVLVVAQGLGCAALKQELELLAISRLSAASATFSLHFAWKHGCGLLMEESMELIVRNWEAATASESWPLVAGCQELLCKLLEHSHAVDPDQDIDTLGMLLSHAGEVVGGKKKILSRHWAEICSK